MTLPERCLEKIRSVARERLGNAAPLVLARVASLMVTVCLPFVLARLLTPAQFGVYKQFFLIAATTLQMMQLGMTQSLFYFVPRAARPGPFILQSALALAAIGAISGLLLYASLPLVASWLADGEIAALRAPLALAAALMLASSPLEPSLTSSGRILGASLAYLLSDAARATAIIVAALLWGGAAMYWAVVLVAAARTLVLWLAILAQTLPRAPLEWAGLRRQMGYALPFAGAGILCIAQRYASQYVVAGSFDAATFALFSVASFHIPVAHIVFTPIAEVLMVRLGGAQTDAGWVDGWIDAVEKLASLLVPSAVAAWILGPSLIVRLFTARYSGAIGLFMIATFEILLAILPTDAVLRAKAETRFLFIFNGARLLWTLLFVLVGIRAGGIAGALVGWLAAETLARAVMAVRVRTLLHTDWPTLLQAALLARITAASLLAALPAWAIHRFDASLPFTAVAMVAYAVTYLWSRSALLRRPTQAPVRVASLMH
jgi:O-antigen/teichoic acid export membrane protein